LHPPSLHQKIARKLGKLLARSRRHPAGRAVYALVEELFDYASNFEQWNLAANGEAALLRRLGRHLASGAVLDVGGKNGEWTLAALAADPGAKVHAFEPSPTTAAAFRRAVAPAGDRVHLEELALGEGPATLTLYEFQDDKVASLRSWYPDVKRETQVPVDSGDRYLARAGIDRVALIKIDVEGFELEVIRGFREAIAAGRIDFIQFEFGSFAWMRGHRLADYYAALGPEYVVGEILPTTVNFFEYDMRRESPRFRNLLAARKSLSHLAV
jgi:FkbM family methyltransferase